MSRGAFIKVGKDGPLSQGPRRAHTKALRQEDARCVYGTVQRPGGWNCLSRVENSEKLYQRGSGTDGIRSLRSLGNFSFSQHDMESHRTVLSQGIIGCGFCIIRASQV